MIFPKLMKFTIFALLFGIIHCSSVCPDGYAMVLDKCLMAIKNPMTHSQAETACTYTGGTLVNIKSAIENRAVSQFASNSGINQTWIGLFCFDNKNPSKCFYDDYSGTSALYDNFASGYPMVDGIYGGCVYTSTSGSLAGRWVSVKCEAESMPFICEMPISTYDASCPHNYNDFCYLKSSEMPIATGKFGDALKICEAQNGSLVSIHSKREIDYIKSLYRDQTSIRTILIGAQLVLPNLYSWTDGSNFESFDYRDPLSSASNNDNKCLFMDISSGLWSSGTCDYIGSSFLCKIPLSVVPTPQSEILSESNPSDFSKCNTTFLMAPGEFTSYGYLSTDPAEPPVYCTWKIVTTGAYKMRLFFTDVNTYNPIYVYAENGNEIERVRYSSSSVISRSNIVNVAFQASGRPGYTGFKAVVLAY
ncbi:Protein CBG07170 [Caenorhabditis briggsae]|uniref:Protein CBG07170 n=1 Tax=Caenorhabditis briggsae TaxID=6238 RepID=A8X3J9_CAEBR|nr:Protein CBG07170 [Caenorhabditis briggsae]CAP27209.1 Protein CBG07170 [Caenorhabditis briggsae]